MVRVLAFGTFDRFHPGHDFFLRAAKAKGDVWVVVARDRTVERVKGKRPVQNEEERKQAVEHAFPDMHVLLGDSHDYLAPLRSVQPDLIVLGYDQTLPPGLTEADVPCAMERLPAHEPTKYKSSLLS
ncbi:MAG: adenylyltransferase/cytidyltransferase family protein [Candidatus Peribacteraceae bacterium]|nr:adenylyltransferase/cytidyltransferase family protein [Candidatus Peribacteraceae bacterium]